MDNLLSMSGFALAASISPGPVNLVTLSSSIQHGLGVSMRHVTGATVGFTLLLLLIGLGIHELLVYLPNLISVLKWLGVAFLLYMAFKLATDDGTLGTQRTGNAPSFLSGAAMQWLNPKAWLASLAGMGAYAGSELHLVWQFAGIYFVICYASLSCWAAVGLCLRRYVDNPKRIRMLNRSIAALVVFSAIWLIVE
jgi:threonine/homoserine/homoserine lactone efflux protein